MCADRARCSWIAFAGTLIVAGAGSAAIHTASARNGGGGAGEAGTATHQHLDARFAHNRYYYANDTYYVSDGQRNEYVVVAPPQGLAPAQYYNCEVDKRIYSPREAVCTAWTGH